MTKNRNLTSNRILAPLNFPLTKMLVTKTSAQSIRERITIRKAKETKPPLSATRETSPF